MRTLPCPLHLINVQFHCRVCPAVYGACSINLVTGEPSVPRPAVRRQVASKLLLTKQQAQQLAVSLAEFERGSSLTNNQGANLVQEAADAGVLVALLARQNLNDDKAEHKAAGNHDDAAVTAEPAQVLVAASAEQRAGPQAALAGGTSSAVPAQDSKSEADEADQAGEAGEKHLACYFDCCRSKQKFLVDKG